MAKVLITSIGGGKKGGNYNPAIYEIENKKYDERKFIASALEEHYHIDKTIFIGTVGSMWENVYDYYCDKLKIERDKNYYFELAEGIENANKRSELNLINTEKFNSTFNGKIKAVVTKYGMEEKEIFENFNIIINSLDDLKDGDELYLDITHAFRSNAFWILLVINYLSDVMDKKIKIKAISYGMFEAKENGVTPVVDLYAFYKILKWIKAASSFKEYGNTYLLALVDENLNQTLILDEDLNKKMLNFSDALNMNYIASLRQNINSLKKMEAQLDKLEGPGALIIPAVVKEFLKEFETEDKDYVFQAKLAKWHFKEKRYAMAAININEALVSFINEALEIELTEKEKENNNLSRAKSWLKRAYDLLNENKSLLKDKKVMRDYAEIYVETRRIRNEAAHSIGVETTISSDIRKLETYCEKINEIFEQANLIKEIEKEYNLLPDRTKRDETKKRAFSLTYTGIEEEKIKILREECGIVQILYLTVEERNNFKKGNLSLKLLKKSIKDKLNIENSDIEYIIIPEDTKFIKELCKYSEEKNLKILLFSKKKIIREYLPINSIEGDK